MIISCDLFFTCDKYLYCTLYSTINYYLFLLRHVLHAEVMDREHSFNHNINLQTPFYKSDHIVHISFQDMNNTDNGLIIKL